MDQCFPKSALKGSPTSCQGIREYIAGMDDLKNTYFFN